jgi:hypothetical protein
VCSSSALSSSWLAVAGAECSNAQEECAHAVRDEDRTGFPRQRKLLCMCIETDPPAQQPAMFGWFSSMWEWITSLFWRQEMELTLVGLQNSGKTTLVNVISVSAHHGARYSCGSGAVGSHWFPLLFLTCTNAYAYLFLQVGAVHRGYDSHCRLQHA